jgi:uncharacterized membrane protein YbhN (UPF0104 family)
MTRPTAEMIHDRPSDVGDRSMTVIAHPASRALGARHRRQLRSGLVTAVVLTLLVGGLILAVPGLGSVAHRVAHAHWGWLILGGALELASCLGFVLAFQAIFTDVPRRFGLLVAMAEQAFGAVVPVGGAGGIAAGGWLLSRAGMTTRVIAQRSGVLFLVTSATNVIALVLAGLGLAIGAFAGPHNLLLSALPAAAGLAVLTVFIALAPVAPARAEAEGKSRRSLMDRVVAATAGASAESLRTLRRPGRRLAVAALAFLFCDIAVLWVAIQALGYSVPVGPLILAYLIGYLGNAIPVPGGLGVLDGGLAAVLVLYGVPAPAAVGGVLLYHVVALWIPTLSGTLGFLAAQREISANALTLEVAAADCELVRAPASELRERGRRHLGAEVALAQVSVEAA